MFNWFCNNNNNKPQETSETEPVKSGFVFSERSKDILANRVNTDLARSAYFAIECSNYDFGITSGFRSAQEQHQLYMDNKSNCDGFEKRSKHQDGDAIDIVVYDENGKVTWDPKYYAEVAKAFWAAALSLNVRIRWGGPWVVLNDTLFADDIPQLIPDYVNRRRSEGYQPFVDACHFEILA